MRTYILLLVDVIETFKNKCKKNYDLDPAHFYAALGLSWQAALKMTNIQLDLLTDIGQHLFIEFCYRYAKLFVVKWILMSLNL